MKESLDRIMENTQQLYINKEIEEIINNNKLIIKERDNLNEPVSIKTAMNDDDIIKIKHTNLTEDNYVKTNKGDYHSLEKEYTYELLNTLINESLRRNIINNWIEEHIKEPIEELSIIDEEKAKNETKYSYKTRYIINDKVLEIELGANYNTGSKYMMVILENKKEYNYDGFLKNTYNLYKQELESMNNALYEQKRLKTFDN